MSGPIPLIPRQPVPPLEVTTTDGTAWRLHDRKPANFTLISIYRGLHCPICSRYLAELDGMVPALAELGVDAITISSDSQDRAVEAKEKWGLDSLTVGYGLSLDTARNWGLYISTGRGKTSAGTDEPSLFVEPGLFLVRPDYTLYFCSVQSMPFARPQFKDILGAIKFVLDKDYPARGEVVDHRATTEPTE